MIAMIESEPSFWQHFIGQQVVLDLSSPFVVLGEFVEARGGFLLLENVDVHDLRETPSSRDIYTRQALIHGVSANRRRSWIRLAEVVDISRLDDVVLD